MAKRPLKTSTRGMANSVTETRPEAPAAMVVTKTESGSPKDFPAGGQIWRNRGGELITVETALAGSEDRLYCRFLQPRYAPAPGYLVDSEGRYFSRSFVPLQGDNPFDLVTLVERSLAEKESAAWVGPRIGRVNSEDPGRVLEIFSKVADVIKAKGQGGEPRQKLLRHESETGIIMVVNWTTKKWQLGEATYEEDVTKAHHKNAPTPEISVSRLMVTIDASRPDGWWSVDVMDGEKPYLRFSNGTIGELFLLAGALLPMETIFARMRGVVGDSHAKKRVAKKRVTKKKLST